MRHLNYLLRFPFIRTLLGLGLIGFTGISCQQDQKAPWQPSNADSQQVGDIQLVTTNGSSISDERFAIILGKGEDRVAYLFENHESCTRENLLKQINHNPASAIGFITYNNLQEEYSLVDTEDRLLPCHKPASLSGDTTAEPPVPGLAIEYRANALSIVTDSTSYMIEGVDEAGEFNGRYYVFPNRCIQPGLLGDTLYMNPNLTQRSPEFIPNLDEYANDTRIDLTCGNGTSLNPTTGTELDQGPDGWSLYRVKKEAQYRDFAPLTLSQEACTEEVGTWDPETESCAVLEEACTPRLPGLPPRTRVAYNEDTCYQLFDKPFYLARYQWPTSSASERPIFIPIWQVDNLFAHEIIAGSMTEAATIDIETKLKAVFGIESSEVIAEIAEKDRQFYEYPFYAICTDTQQCSEEPIYYSAEKWGRFSGVMTAKTINTTQTTVYNKDLNQTFNSVHAGYDAKANSSEKIERWLYFPACHDSSTSLADHLGYQLDQDALKKAHLSTFKELSSYYSGSKPEGIEDFNQYLAEAQPFFTQDQSDHLRNKALAEGSVYSYRLPCIEESKSYPDNSCSVQVSTEEELIEAVNGDACSTVEPLFLTIRFNEDIVLESGSLTISDNNFRSITLEGNDKKLIWPTSIAAPSSRSSVVVLDSPTTQVSIRNLSILRTAASSSTGGASIGRSTRRFPYAIRSYQTSLVLDRVTIGLEQSHTLEWLNTRAIPHSSLQFKNALFIEGFKDSGSPIPVGKIWNSTFTAERGVRAENAALAVGQGTTINTAYAGLSLIEATGTLDIVKISGRPGIKLIDSHLNHFARSSLFADIPKVYAPLDPGASSEFLTQNPSSNRLGSRYALTFFDGSIFSGDQIEVRGFQKVTAASGTNNLFNFTYSNFIGNDTNDANSDNLEVNP